MRPSPQSVEELRFLLAACILACAEFAQGDPAPPAPSELWQDLFVRVEEARLYPDSKTFADAVPRFPPEQILADYRRDPPADQAALAAFVASHFDLPGAPAVEAPWTREPSLRRHIAALWPQLMRPPHAAAAGSSELAIDFRHIVPGGRFRELYYWDSYFSLLGLTRDGYSAVARDMVDGFAGLIARYHHMPNGTRTYYLSRSQPPVFYLMVGLLAPGHPAAAYARYLTALRTEYAWWMDGADGLTPGAAAGHVVKLDDGTVLNRYWDARDVPRDESYAEDVALSRRSGRQAPELYRELRSAAESGWDFSSRWFADGRNLASIETTAIVPVDLNSLLYGLEQAIAQGCRYQRDMACARDFAQRARRRRAAIDTWLWNASDGCYYDYQWRERRPTRRLSAATLYPLFTGASGAGQAAAVAATVRARLLMPGGLGTTTTATGQQWDRPNGWAPLQWIGIAGLRARGEPELARTIACRWLGTVRSAYSREDKLVEKYDVENGDPAVGGEYPLQDGFGWTNGVTGALLDQYPGCLKPQATRLNGAATPLHAKG